MTRPDSSQLRQCLKLGPKPYCVTILARSRTSYLVQLIHPTGAVLYFDIAYLFYVYPPYLIYILLHMGSGYLNRILASYPLLTNRHINWIIRLSNLQRVLKRTLIYLDNKPYSLLSTLKPARKT